MTIETQDFEMGSRSGENYCVETGDFGEGTHCVVQSADKQTM